MSEVIYTHAKYCNGSHITKEIKSKRMVSTQYSRHNAAFKNRWLRVICRNFKTKLAFC